ncbi:LCP family protein [Bifidobacterium tibiigranuli]|jgi:LCP family protein required for cell wall assembly|uniref:LCP family protein n=1 Tax=Bifidobacterium tibiigranuli TaxID=2172043 RepID=UPI002352BAAB|nr:LCP family protein [Bifidobacterium tibiigranuli]MCI1210668.1 LCP family protein [Bifidobacterium tibiigranuli]MCI1220774.1 LCP family protein [Bifidobacterium tibiigranuli]MCI1232306.1 LCP family protein [Bifidobacterium tibiigranuli]
MSLETDGTNTPATPPSFVPASMRKRRSPQDATPAADAMESAGLDPSHGEPARFTPQAKRRAAFSHQPSPRSSSQSPAHQSSSQASYQASAQPSARQYAAHDAHTANAASSAPSFQPTHSSHAAEPQASAPRAARPARRSTGSTSRTGSAVQPASFGSQSRSAEPYRAEQHRAGQRNNAALRNAAPRGSGKSGVVGPAQSGATRTRHRGLRRLLIAVAIIIAVLILAMFGTWNWVDGRLNKSDWVTNHADTAGTSWLILGSDKRDGTTGDDGTTGYRTDTILVLTKPNSGPSSLISVPRDSLVNVNGEYMKINAVAQADGQKQLVAQVENITGQHIDHVALIQFGGLKGIVDALGGVQLCYDHTVDDVDSGMKWQAGCHLANGDTALAFSRMRYSDPQSDFGRAARQRQVIGAIISTAAKSSTLANPGKLNKVATAALKSITVDQATNPYTLAQMAMAFRAATGAKGINGTLYWTDPGYYVDGVGSSVLLDDAKNHALFSELAQGTHAPGTVGTLEEAAQQ